MSKELLIGPGSCLNSIREEEKWQAKMKAFREDPKARNALRAIFIKNQEEKIKALEEEINKLMIKMFEKDHEMNNLKVVVEDIKKAMEKE